MTDAPASNCCPVNTLGNIPAKTDTRDGGSPFRPGVLVPYGTTMVEAELMILQATLGRCFGNKTRAAQALGISLKTIYNILNRDKAKRAGASS